MADDVAGLIKHLKLEKIDIFGYSMGGGVALQLGTRHPQLINKMVTASASYKSEGMYPELTTMIGQMKPEYMEGTPFKAAYDTLSPDLGIPWRCIASKVWPLPWISCQRLKANWPYFPEPPM